MPNKKSQKSKASKNKLKIIIGVAVASVLVVVVAVVAILSNSAPSKYKLNTNSPTEAFTVSYLRFQVALDKLSGGGKIKQSDCEVFRNLAKAYDKNSDWFKPSYCSYIIYADYNDTEQSATVTLSDGTHAAVYTFDPELDYLLDYKFIDSTTKGQGILIED